MSLFEKIYNWKEKNNLLKEFKINEEILKKSLHQEKENQIIRTYALVSNLFFESTTQKLTKLFQRPSQIFQKNILTAGMNILFNTYLSMLIFTSFILLFIGTALGTVIFYQFSIVYGLFLGIILAIISAIIFIFYPNYSILKRKKELSEEYPFIINHCAALINSQTDPKEIFSILIHTSYYKSFKIDCKRIYSYTKILNLSFPESLRKTAQINPSKEIKEFFEEYAKFIEDKKDLKRYFNDKARETLTKYKQKKTFFQRINNSKEELHQIFLIRNFYPNIVIFITGISFLFWYYPLIDFKFYIYLFTLALLIFSPTIIKQIILIKRNRVLEIQFTYLIKDLDKTQNPLKLNRNYKELQPLIEKLKNQYSLAIPIEKSLETFAKETKSPLINATIVMALEANKYHANIFTALKELGCSEILRKVLKN